jgi:hypothetical protein
MLQAHNQVPVIEAKVLEGETTREQTQAFVASRNISPGTLLLTDIPKILFPSFHLRHIEDYSFGIIDPRKGVVPKTWVCFGCMKTVGNIYPHWCSKCGIPLCSTGCELHGAWHSNECKMFSKLQIVSPSFFSTFYVSESESH